MPPGREPLVAAGLIALILAFRLWLSAVFPMTGDEAYFVVWGVEPDWGYYDHPPMVGWLLALLAPLSRAEWVLRLPATLLPLVVSGAMYLALRRIDERRALYASLAFALVPISVWNVFITTDTPLAFFCFVSGLAWWKARLGRSDAWHAAAGVFLGLAFLSKYFAVLLGLVYVVDALLARPARPLRGLAVTLLAALPFALLNAWWNYGHCWANLMFNVYNRHDDAGLSWKTPLLFAAIVLYTLSPPAMVHALRARAASAERWREPGFRFFSLAVSVPMAVFGLVSFVRPVGLHWVLSFVPFFFMAAAMLLTADQLRRSAVYLGSFTLLHLAAIAAAAAVPLEAWKGLRIHDGLVFHFRIEDVARELRRLAPEYVLAADGYSPAVTLSHATGSYVFVFGTGSSHARHDDLMTDVRALQGRNIAVFRKNPPEPAEYQPYFESVEYRSFGLSGATFHVVLGRNFDYAAYRDRVLTHVRDRYYRIPWYLPQGGCVFCERYFGTSCPVRNG